MRSKSTEMAKNVCVRTTCLFKSIRKDREPATVQCARRQVSLFVGVLGEMDHGAVIPGQPRRINAYCPEVRRLTA